MGFITLVILAVLAGMFVASSIKIVHQQTVGVVETMGRFSRVLTPGLHFLIPVIQQIVARVDLRVQEIAGKIEIKTKDNVFVELPVALMTQVIAESASKSHYSLAGSDNRKGSNLGSHKQVATWALNALRSAAAGLTLQQLFEDRMELAAAVKDDIDEKLKAYGFHVVDVLVDQPTVSDEVQASFNRVVASLREREAAEQEAEAKRIRIVGEAKADSQAQALRAEGVAKAREILANGLTAAMESAKSRGVNERELLTLLVETNRLDTIRAAAEHGKLVVMDSRHPVPIALQE